MPDLPSFAQLPAGEHGEPRAWQLFGSDDNIGLINLLTPEVVLTAARLVRQGKVFPLNAPLDLFAPPPFAGRGVPRRSVRTRERPATTTLDDCLDNFFPQGSSQWDSLAHVALRPGQFYNGVSHDDVLTRHRNTIDHWAQRGIVGRGVVLDLTVDRELYDPGSSCAFTVDDLERARQRQGITYQRGDILIFNTGFAAWFAEQTEERRTALQKAVAAPGLDHSKEVVAYLWDHHFSAVASDTLAVEAFPYDPAEAAMPYGFLHQTLIGGFGMALGELWWLQDLVADCRSDGVYEVMLVSAPAHIRGGMGSPANAIAIK